MGEIKKAERIFKYNDEALVDTAPNLPPSAVLRHYSALKSELINASISGPVIVDGKMEYEFKLELGTKG